MWENTRFPVDNPETASELRFNPETASELRFNLTSLLARVSTE